MKIVSWNCNGALRKKTNFIDEFDADVLVIQECEDPSQSTKSYREWASEYLWAGKNKSKGIGIFARNGKRISRLNWQGTYTLPGIENHSASLSWDSKDLQSFLPCMVNDKFVLLGIWTKKANSQNFGYIGQFWKYLQVHKIKLSKDNVILCGDLNSNAIWDQPDRWWNHSEVVKELEEIGVHSLYHYLENETQGHESRNTFYMYRKLDKPFHIDYTFLSKNLLGSSSLEIGEAEQWIKQSDHVPLIVTING